MDRGVGEERREAREGGLDAHEVSAESVGVLLGVAGDHGHLRRRRLAALVVARRGGGELARAELVGHHLQPLARRRGIRRLQTRKEVANARIDPRQRRQRDVGGAHDQPAELGDEVGGGGVSASGAHDGAAAGEVVEREPQQLDRDEGRSVGAQASPSDQPHEGQGRVSRACVVVGELRGHGQIAAEGVRDLSGQVGRISPRTDQVELVGREAPDHDLGQERERVAGLAHGQLDAARGDELAVGEDGGEPGAVEQLLVLDLEHKRMRDARPGVRVGASPPDGIQIRGDDGEGGRVGTAAEGGLLDQAAPQHGGRDRPSNFHVAQDQLEHSPQPGGAHQGEVEELRADRGVEREHPEAKPEPQGEGDRAFGVADSSRKGRKGDG